MLFVIKRGDQISASLSETLAAYKKMLNCQHEKKYFGVALTHCDINFQNANGDNPIIERIIENDYEGKLESSEAKRQSI